MENLKWTNAAVSGMEPLQLLGPLDALGPYVEYLILALVLVNMATRARAHHLHTRQAEESDDAEALARSTLHEGTNALLILTSFYFLTYEAHAGMVMSVLVVGMVVSDFFEFEARKVEARKDEPLDRPNGALFASAIVLLYAAYQALFFLIKPLWSAIV